MVPSMQISRATGEAHGGEGALRPAQIFGPSRFVGGFGHAPSASWTMAGNAVMESVTSASHAVGRDDEDRLPPADSRALCSYRSIAGRVIEFHRCTARCHRTMMAAKQAPDRQRCRLPPSMAVAGDGAMRKSATWTSKHHATRPSEPW